MSEPWKTLTTKRRQSIPTKQAMLKYGLDDSRNCLNLWKKLEKDWPTQEREISRIIREAGIRGVRLNLDLLSDALKKVQVMSLEAKRKIPWMGQLSASGKPIPPTSPKQIRIACEELGIEAPASTAKSDPKFQTWLDTYGTQAEFVQGINTVRSCERSLKVLEAIECRRRDDILPFSIKYFGNWTGRPGGGDKSDKEADVGSGGLNLLNLPRPDTQAKLGLPDIRSIFIPREGKVFADADYSNAELRIVYWLAQDQPFLELVKSSPDIYEAFADQLFDWRGAPGTLKIDNPKLRQECKIVGLGIQYMMGAKRLSETSSKPMDESQAFIDLWRSKNPLIKKNCWDHFKRCLVSSIRADEDLQIELPSGRNLNYRNLRMEQSEHSKWPSYVADLGGRKRYLHPGSITENCCQSIQSDILTHATIQIDKAGHDVILTPFDEILCEVDEGTDIKEITDLMVDLPECYDGLPVAAEGAIMKYWSKV